ncbi:MAG: adenylate/guanylate cyclase domain-containing protein [Dehalococcoidia bacterium]
MTTPIVPPKHGFLAAPVPTESILLPYIPRLLVDWQQRSPGETHLEVAGTLVFVDISGFTRLSERLAARGKVGAEEVTQILNAAFGRLLALAYEDGGALIKFGGDALVLLFSGTDHALHACRAAVSMRRDLRIQRAGADVGVPPLRMSVGVHTGLFDFFLAGGSHKELVITGPAATATVAMESAAVAGEILVSGATAALLPRACRGAAKGEGVLLKRAPEVAPIDTSPATISAALELAAFVPVRLRPHLGTASAEGEHRLATIGFIKFFGVDDLLEKSGPAAVAEALDALIRAVQVAADRYGVCFLSTDIDGGGGKVILTAGVPDGSPDDEERMLLVLREVADSLQALPLRIGVNRGPVFAGDVGASFRRAYTVMGDAVNLAARLMAKAAPGQVIASPGVTNRSGTLFQLTEIEPFMVKGKSKPQEASLVGAPRGHRSDADALRLPTVGREAELAFLQAEWQLARSGSGRVVEIVGESGVGKSRIVDDFLGLAEGGTTLRVTGVPYAARIPYYALRETTRRLLRVTLDGPAGGRQIEATLDRIAPHLRPWAPLLAVVADVPVPPTPETEALDDLLRRRRTAAVIAELAAIASPAAALVIFEDLYFMDEASLGLVGELIAGIAERPWLICLVTRADALAAIPPGVPASRLSVEALSPAAAAELADAAAELLGAPADRLGAATSRASGNPLFLLELVGAAARGDDEFPDTLEAVIGARIDELEPGDRFVLRYASVVGDPFDLTMLDRVLANDGFAVEAAAWERLSPFVEPNGGGTYHFRHRLFRDAIYGGLPFRRRRAIHERVGRAIEARSAGQDSAADLLALHFWRAQLYPEAWRYCREAGERARAKFANGEAAEYFSQALQAARRVAGVAPADLADVNETLGDVSDAAGRFDQADGAFAAARTLTSDELSRARLLRKQGMLRERRGEYAKAARWLGRALHASKGDGRDAVWSFRDTTVALAGVRLRQGRFKECVGLCRQVIAASPGQARGDREAMARAYYTMDIALGRLGDRAAGGYYAKAIAIFREISDVRGEASALNNLGVHLYFAGEIEQSLECWRQSEVAYRRIGMVVEAAIMTNNIAEALSDLGQVGESEKSFREALRVFRASHYGEGIPQVLSNLGRCATRLGRYEDAEQLLNEAGTAFRAVGLAEHAIETDFRLLENALAASEWETAKKRAEALLKREGATAVSQSPATLRRMLGEAHAALGEREAAVTALEVATKVAEANGLANELALASALLAQLG